MKFSSVGILCSATILIWSAGLRGDDHTPTESLRRLAGARLLIGAAVSASSLKDESFCGLLANQFNCLTAENEMKPASLEPRPGVFTFDTADRLVDFARTHDMAVIGHNLCWHQQTPAWFYQSPDGKPLARAAALANLKRHIDAVVGHFKGKVLGWDVVNEAVSDSGPQDLRDCPARRAIGDDFVETAFRLARDADPNVELYYNDYNIEQPDKRAKTIRLIRRLKAAGLRIDAVGIQGHWSLAVPDLKTIEDAIIAFRAEGVKVSVTELDIDVLPSATVGGDLDSVQRAGADPYRLGCPDAVLKQQADRYRSLFDLFNRHRDAMERCTFWGVSDRNSWLNDFPVRGRVNYPLLWDRNLRPKAAFDGVVESLRKRPAT